MRWRLAASIALALVARAGWSSADIDPPSGYAWVRDNQVIVTDTRAVPDWVLVQFPCSRTEKTHCVLSDGDVVGAWDGLYALPKSAVVLGPVDGGNPGERVVVDPDLTLAFFEKDPRVASLRPPSAGLGRTVKNVAVVKAQYFLSFQAAGPRGIEARFVRARYECSGGGVVEMPWGSTEEPPVPTCPVTDDRGELDGGASSEVPAFTARRYPLPAPRGRVMWVGLALASIGFLSAGLLLRKAPEKK